MLEHRTWTNPYGFEERYVWKWITHSKTGHLWHGSAMETDSSCGNCDGGKCSSCKDVWEVTVYGEPVPHYDSDWGYDYNECKVLDHRRFYTEKEAIEYFESVTD